MVEKFGVKGIEFEEIYDVDSIGSMEDLFGLIFLFKYKGEKDNRPTEEFTPIFFANQVISNACATQAIISILLNISDKIDIGEELKSFKEFTKDLPFDLRGLALSNSDNIKAVHNSFAKPEPFVMEKVMATEKDDVFHFISYVPINDTLWELDGLKKGPIKLTKLDEKTTPWQQEIVPIIRKRIETYTKTEIRFNLMGLVRSKTFKLESQIKSLREIIDNKKGTEAQLKSASNSLASAEADLIVEQDKRKKWEIENIRRRHNYVPFLYQVLTVLAENNQLIPLLEKAKEEKAEKAKAKEDANKSKKSSTNESSSTAVASPPPPQQKK